MKLKLIGCEVLYREICLAVARSPHQIDVEFLPKGLHDLGGTVMQARLQEVIDRVDPSQFEAILLGYALCGNGALGLKARTLPLVVPRAHDCIALLLGSRQRYSEYFESHSGVYFRSTGWIERGASLEQASNPLILRQVGVSYNLPELIRKYGEDNGRYLYEQFTQFQRNYSQLTYIETGLESDDHFERSAREEAQQRGWRFEKLRGDLVLFERLVSGDWLDQEFLIVPRGFRVAVTYDDDIIRAEESPS
jgi:hypothetical protein